MLAAGARLKKQILKARSHPGHFIEFVWRTPTGEKVKLEPFHWEWLDLMMNERRLQIEASKSHGKTTVMLGFIIWSIGNAPNIRVKLFTQSEEKARERLGLVGEMIKRNKLVKLVFPWLRPDPDGVWHKGAISVVRDSGASKDPTMEAGGIMGSVEGGRCDRIFLDDCCLTHGSLIISKRGLIAIQDVEVGDWLRNHEGTWSRVGEIHKRTVKEIAELKADGWADKLRVTPEHPLFASTRHRLQGKAKEAAGTSLRFDTPDFATAAELAAQTGATEHHVPLLADPICQEPKAPLDLDELWVKFETPLGAKGQHTNAARTQNPLHDPEFWWLVGLWLAEGWTAQHKLKTSISRTVWFSLHRDERGTLAARLQSIAARLLNRKVCVTKDGDKRAIRAIISDKALYFFLREFRRDDEYQDKEAPSWVYDLPTECIRQLIIGYWQGDGSTGTRGHYRVASVSTPLLAQMQVLLTRFGITSFLGKARKNRRSKRKIRELGMSRDFGREVLQHEDVEPAEYGWITIQDGYVLRPIRKAKTVPGACTVYNLTMDQGPHSYCGPGHTSHNCDHRTSLLYPQTRDAIVKKVYAELLPMLEEDGRAISIATPHHAMDAVASLRRNPEWTSRIFAVGTAEDPFLPIWPGRWSREALRRLYNEVGSIEYNRAYRCLELASETKLVKPEHIQYYDGNILGDPYELVCVQAYDLAITDRKKSSYFAGVTLLYDPDRNYIFVADAWRDKLDFAEQARILIAESKKWQPNMIVVEETGYQSALRTFVQDLADEPIPIFPVKPGNRSKEMRLMEAIPMFEGKRIFFNPRMDPANLEVVARGDLIGQLLTFSNSKDQDLGDAFAYGVITLRDYKYVERDESWATGEGVATRLSVL